MFCIKKNIFRKNNLLFLPRNMVAGQNLHHKEFSIHARQEVFRSSPSFKKYGHVFVSRPGTGLSPTTQLVFKTKFTFHMMPRTSDMRL